MGKKSLEKESLISLPRQIDYDIIEQNIIYYSQKAGIFLLLLPNFARGVG